jgi:hypothetical protein
MTIPSNGHAHHHHSKHLHGHWKKAAEQTKHLSDPWQKFHIDENFPDEVGIRHRYNARKKTWVKDEVHVRMEEEVWYSLLAMNNTYVHPYFTLLIPFKHTVVYILEMVHLEEQSLHPRPPLMFCVPPHTSLL